MQGEWCLLMTAPPGDSLLTLTVQGDSGGALTLEKSGGRVVAGLVSHGDPTCAQVC